MPLPKVARTGLLTLAIGAIAAGSAAGDASVVEVNNLVLRADGGFKPQTLPKRRFAPIDFQGHVEIAARRGGAPAPLQQALIDFDRDGRLEVAGLPTCPAERVAQGTTQEARSAPRGALGATRHG